MIETSNSTRTNNYHVVIMPRTDKQRRRRQRVRASNYRRPDVMLSTFIFIDC